MSGLLLSYEQIQAARAAAREHFPGLDRYSYVEGYKAAMRDIGRGVPMEHAGVIYPDPDGAANRSYDAGGEDWSSVIVAERARAAEVATPPDDAGSRFARREGWVYVLSDGAGRVKIGWTGDSVSARASSVRAASGCDLMISFYVPGTLRDERAAHDRLKGARIRGEWFDVTPEVVQWLREIVQREDCTVGDGAYDLLGVQP